MGRKLSPEEIVQKMFSQDAFSNWMGIEILQVSGGFCQLRMTVRKEMLNGFHIAHGGISYSFSDSAFAFASNSQGNHAVSIETSISHLARISVGDVLTATAKEEYMGNKIGVYAVDITNQKGQKISLFKGTVYRSERQWCEI